MIPDAILTVAKPKALCFESQPSPINVLGAAGLSPAKKPSSTVKKISAIFDSAPAIKNIEMDPAIKKMQGGRNFPKCNDTTG